jgi:predicted O-methyltransferase YrrM
MMTAEELMEYADNIEGEGNAKIGKTSSDFMCTMTRRELLAMAQQLVQMPRGATIVEIGVYCGRSASIALNLQPELDLDITLIDNWSWNAPDSKIAFWHFIEEKFPHAKFKMQEMTSHEARELWDGRGIDFIHIDACHDEFWVDKDCAMWLPLVKVSGVAMFHDYLTTEIQNAGVVKAVDNHCNLVNGWETLGEAQRLAIRRKVIQVPAPPVQPLLEELWKVHGRPALEAQ